MPKLMDITGVRYGRLIGVKFVGKTKHHKSIWLCKCDCGNTIEVVGASLVSGNTSSCGCFNLERIRESSTVHGGYAGNSKDKLTAVWNDMKKRCENPKVKCFKHYGGRGITVCKEWLHAPTFFKWARENGWKEGLQIDRRDNERGYSPDNCRFVTCQRNINNRRREFNPTGYTGIMKLPSGLFNVAVGSKDVENGKVKYLGSFKTKKEALSVRNKFIEDNNLMNRTQAYHGE